LKYIVQRRIVEWTHNIARRIWWRNRYEVYTIC